MTFVTNGRKGTRWVGVAGISLALLAGGAASAQQATPALRTDLNQDGVVDRADVVMLLRAMMATVSATTAEARQAAIAGADVNNDRVLSSVDLRAMLTAMSMTAAQLNLTGMLREIGAPTNLLAQAARPPTLPSSGAAGSGSGAGGGGGGANPSVPTGTPPSPAWTSFRQAPGSVTVYVSSSTGSDANTGASPATPLKTIQAGMNRLRSGQSDWILLKKGDTFTGGLGGSWNKSGRSPQEPMLIGSYGDGTQRPRLNTGTRPGFRKLPSNTVTNLAIVGISMSPESYTGNENAIGISWIGPGGNLLVEDCEIDGFGTGIAINGWQDVAKGFTVRRSVISDSYAIHAHSQGIFMNMVDGITIEENVLDHNGWKEGLVGAEPTIFNHNIYLTKETTVNTVVRGNIVANASSHGMQMRRGGVCENNLVIGNPIGILMGQAQSAWPSQSATGVIRNNVVIESRDIDNDPRGYGIWLQMSDGVTVEKNLVANQTRGRAPAAFRVDTNFRNLRFDGNVVYNWSAPGGNGGVAFQFVSAGGEGAVTVARNTVAQTNGASVIQHKDVPAAGLFRYEGNRYNTTAPANRWFRLGQLTQGISAWAPAMGDTGSVAQATAFPDASRSVGTYSASVGGPATIEGFLAEARKQSKGSWRQAFTATAANAWIRTGFGLN